MRATISGSRYAPGVTLTGKGESVALVEFIGYFPSDIRQYETQFHLPNVALTNILLDGVSSVTNGASGLNADEPPLDVEMSMSMAPGLSSVMAYYGRLGDTVLNRIAADNAARQVSASWTYSTDPTTITDISGDGRPGPVLLQRLRRLGCLHRSDSLAGKHSLHHHRRGHRPDH